MSLQINKTWTAKQSADLDFVAMIVHDSKAWVEVKDVARLTGLSTVRTRLCLESLRDRGAIASKSIGNTIVYAKKGLVVRAKPGASPDTEYKEAKSKFQCWPTLMQGSTHKEYDAKPREMDALAMLSRRP